MTARDQLLTVPVAFVAENVAIVAGRADVIPLITFQLAAGFAVGRYLRAGWLAAMLGVVVAGTVIAIGMLHSNFEGGVAVVASLGILLFTPGYLLGNAAQRPPAPAVGPPSAIVSDSAVTPRAKVSLAVLILTADVLIAVWFLSTFRIMGP